MRTFRLLYRFTFFEHHDHVCDYNAFRSLIFSNITVTHIYTMCVRRIPIYQSNQTLYVIAIMVGSYKKLYSHGSIIVTVH